MRAARLCHLDQRQADRPAAKNEHVLLPNIAASACLHANCDRLGEGGKRERESFRDVMDVCGRCKDILCEAARAMDADDLEIGAAILLANPAWVTCAAADERLHHHAITFGNADDSNANFRNGACDLMPANDRVLRVGIDTFVDIQIACADAGSADGH